MVIVWIRIPFGALFIGDCCNGSEIGLHPISGSSILPSPTKIFKGIIIQNKE